MGWGVDWLLGYFGIHTKPFFLILMFILGGAAGVRNVIKAAQEINAEMTKGATPAASVTDDEES